MQLICALMNLTIHRSFLIVFLDFPVKVFHSFGHLVKICIPRDPIRQYKLTFRPITSIFTSAVSFRM